MPFLRTIVRSYGLAASIMCILVVSTISENARAGGGPQNVVVVVNTESWASQTVANEFIKLRHIPDCNVVHLKFDLSYFDCNGDVETFREKLLKPVLQQIKDRGLEGQIDCIAWSSDFPTGIDFSKDFGGSGGMVASINSLTYLYEQVLTKGTYADLNNNKYYRLATPKPAESESKSAYDVQPSCAFSSRTTWGDDNNPAQSGRKYMLSIMLGATSGRGNSVTEVLDCLKRAASADGTNPKGTFYYMYDWSIRTETRLPWFKAAMAALKSIDQETIQITKGHPKNAKGEIDQEHVIAVPEEKDDIIGAMLGQQFPHPKLSRSKTLPGAIVENLTSESGIIDWAGSQMPISEFIRFGAAGTSGVVIEPSAIWQKFPHPFIFYHYAKGCNLIESFYESVSGPYQLLILGDPLCQPFAKIPKISIDGLKAGEKVKDKLAITAKVENYEPAKLQSVQLYVDGKKIMDNAAGKFDLDTTKGADGYHELRVVAIESSPIAMQGSVVVPFEVNNKGQQVELTASEKKVVFGKNITLKASSKGAQEICIVQNSRQLDSKKSVAAASGTFEIDSRQLGMGSIALRAVAKIGDAMVSSAPVEIEVVPGAKVPAIKDPSKLLKPGEDFLDGPALTRKALAVPFIVNDMRRRNPLQEANVPAGGEFQIDAWFDAAIDDVYQFHVWTDGKLTIKIDDVTLGTVDHKGLVMLPISLAQGKHRMVAQGTAGPAREFTIRFGNTGPRDIGKRCHPFDAENPSLHFAHIGPKPPTTVPTEVKN